jgi:N6-adenosine-specific RNA methylase IME4
MTTTEYDVLALDPPWPENGGGKIKRGADRHYETRRLVDIPRIVLDSPAWRPAGNALLWMWTTETFLEAAFGVLGALGFRKCAGWIWVKADPVGTLMGRDVVAPSARMGLGQWSRVEHEHLLLARRGDVHVPDAAHRQRSVIYAPRGAHSEKPEAAWNVIEATSAAAFTPAGADPVHTHLRRMELFSRAPRPGWHAWGTLDGPETAPRLHADEVPRAAE